MRGLKAGTTIRGAAAGLTAGIGLGLLMKFIQYASGERVYTLLLNIDFVPGVGARLPEAVEFLLHIAVAVPIGILYIQIVQRLGNSVPWAVAAGLLPAVITWLPLTQWSARTPSPDDAGAFIWWIAGHLVFGMLLVPFRRTYT
ncbi:hypothetical protein [Paenibacillus sambharensis]|uniref:hypothetical protein n=1 Tax=Paenibacillus sambharensis TaxID=1803190 RepID=UPI001FE7A5EB|nr:hypothetical protein [Paenibacillus sambharensis]